MVRPRSSRWFSRQSRKTPISSKYFKVPTDFKVLRHRPPGCPKNRPIDQTTIDPRFSFHCDRITLMVRPRSTRWFSRKIAKNSNLVEIFQSPRRISKSSGTVLRDGPKNRPIDQTTIDPRFSFHCDRITLMVRPRSTRWFSRKSRKTPISSKYFKVRRISKSSGTVLRMKRDERPMTCVFLAL